MSNWLLLNVQNFYNYPLANGFDDLFFLDIVSCIKVIPYFRPLFQLVLECLELDMLQNLMFQNCIF